MANKPKIRFNGHQDDWEEKKVGQATERFDNLRVPIAAKLREHGCTPYYGANGIQDYVNGYTHTGENVLIAEDGANDINNYPVQYVQGDIWVNNHTHVLKGKDGEIDNMFLAFALKRIDYSKMLVGTTRAKLTAEALINMDIVAPLFSEQQKIGEFFAALDELIGAKEEELEKLRQMKQALLEKMFPCEDDNNLYGGGNSQIINLLQDYNLTISTAPNTPQIRFRGFTEPWEKKTFGDYGYISMCKRVMKYQTQAKGEIPFFKIGTFGETPDAFISVELFTYLKKNYQYPNKGDILISAAGTLCRTVEFNGENQYFQDSNIVWLNHGNKLYNPFLKVLYSVVKWNSVEGSTLKRLYNSNILNTKIFIPSLPEQQMIGNFFRAQDNAINAAKEQIQKLIILKQALLDKMFAA